MNYPLNTQTKSGIFLLTNHIVREYEIPLLAVCARLNTNEGSMHAATTGIVRNEQVLVLYV